MKPARDCPDDSTPAEENEHQEQDGPWLTADDLARREELMDRLKAANLDSSYRGWL